MVPVFEFISNASPAIVKNAIGGWWVHSVELPKDGPAAPQLWKHTINARHAMQLVAALRQNFMIERAKPISRLPIGRPVVTRAAASFVRKQPRGRRG